MLADPSSLVPDLVLPQPDNLTPLFNHFQKQPAPPPGEEWMYYPEEEKSGMLPEFVVWTFQIIGFIWEFFWILLYGAIPQALFLAWWIADFAIDLVVRFFIGSWCKPCAWVFIWIVNVPGIVFWFVGGIWRLGVQTWGLPIDGWMILFQGSGCFLRWGHDCRMSKRWRERQYWQLFDVPLWFREIPAPKDFTMDHFKVLSQARRQSTLQQCPIMNSASKFFDF